MYGARREIPYATGVPVDLDQLLLDDTVQRQLSPTALRNQSGGIGDFEIADRSPIRELVSPRPQTTTGIDQPVGFSPDPGPHGLVPPTVRIGR